MGVWVYEGWSVVSQSVRWVWGVWVYEGWGVVSQSVRWVWGCGCMRGGVLCLSL